MSQCDSCEHKPSTEKFCEIGNIFLASEGTCKHYRPSEILSSTEGVNRSFVSDKASVKDATEFRSTLAVIETKDRTKDTYAKRLLQYKSVLANIIKYSAHEFKDLTIEEIEALLPTNEINHNLVCEQPLESKHLFDAPISFDILFRTNASEKIAFNVYFDIEPQGIYKRQTDGATDYNELPHKSSQYDLAKRGVYYLSRMISRQMPNTEKQNYGGIRKCYSIWICLDNIRSSRGYDVNYGVTDYAFSLKEAFGVPEDIVKRESSLVDLMELIIIRAGGPESQSELLNFVNALFRNTNNLYKYIDVNSEDYYDVHREAETMCDIIRDTIIQVTEEVTEEVTERVTKEQRIVGQIIAYIKLGIEKSRIYDVICEDSPITHDVFEDLYQQALKSKGT